MKKLILIVVAVLAAVQLYSQDRVSLIREKLLNRDQSTVIVASHRETGVIIPRIHWRR